MRKYLLILLLVALFMALGLVLLQYRAERPSFQDSGEVRKSSVSTIDKKEHTAGTYEQALTRVASQGQRPKGNAAATNEPKIVVAGVFSKLKGKNPDLKQLEALVNSSDGKARESAGVVLAREGSAAAIDLLLKAIRVERDPAVRENLIELLRSVTNPAAIPVLAREAQDQSDLALHRACRNVMSAMTDPAAATSLLSLLESEKDPKRFEPIAYALSHMSSESAVPTLLKCATAASDAVGKACIQVLGNIANEEAYSGLFEIIGTHDDDERGNVARVVAIQTAYDKRDNRLIPICEAVIDSAINLKAVQTAIDSLVSIPTPEALSALETQVAKKHDPSVSAYLQDGIRRYNTMWSKN
jgi:hypothetical protein